MIAVLFIGAFRRIKSSLEYTVPAAIGMAVSIFVLLMIFSFSNGAKSLLTDYMCREYPRALSITCISNGEDQQENITADVAIGVEEMLGNDISRISFESVCSMNGTCVGDNVSVNINGVYSYNPGTEIVCGRFLSDNECLNNSNRAVISEQTAKRNYNSAENAIGKKLIVKAENGFVYSYEIIGVCKTDEVYASEVEPIYVSFAKMNFDCGQSQPYRIKKFDVVLNSVSDGEIITSRLREYFRSKRGNGEKVKVMRAELMKPIYSAINAVTLLLSIFSLLILSVGSISVRNVIAEIMQSYVREIGVMKAIGASDAIVVAEYLLMGAILASIGIIPGVTAAFGVQYWISANGADIVKLFAEDMNGLTLELYYQPVQLLLAVIVTLASAVIFCQSPVTKAASMNITEALRVE